MSKLSLMLPRSLPLSFVPALDPQIPLGFNPVCSPEELVSILEPTEKGCVSTKDCVFVV